MIASPRVSLLNGGPQVRLLKDGKSVGRVVVVQPSIRVSPVGARGQTGASGATGGAIDWSPPSAQAQWVIPHNMGRIPQVSVTLPDGEQVSADVKHLDVNTVQITFTFATSGTAHLI